MEPKIIYSPEEVSELINQNKAVVIDVRSLEEYSKEHIPGAVNIPDVFCYLSKSTPEGIDDLCKVFENHFSSAGVSQEKVVIFYEDALHSLYGGSCRGFFLMQYLGHQKAGILETGLYGWKKSGLKVRSGTENCTRADFPINRNDSIFATKYDVLNAISDPSIKLIDNRDRCEWLGITSSPYGVDFSPRKGRIPGAIWIEWYSFIDFEDDLPKFKSRDKIIDVCRGYNINIDDKIIIYCFKGARASNTFTALKIAGFNNVKVYFASWNEWSAIEELPVEKGANFN